MSRTIFAHCYASCFHSSIFRLMTSSFELTLLSCNVTTSFPTVGHNFSFVYSSLIYSWFARYVDYYRLPEPTDNVLELLAFIAKKNNHTLRKRNISGKMSELFGVEVGDTNAQPSLHPPWPPRDWQKIVMK